MLQRILYLSIFLIIFGESSYAKPSKFMNAYELGVGEKGVFFNLIKNLTDKNDAIHLKNEKRLEIKPELNPDIKFIKIKDKNMISIADNDLKKFCNKSIINQLRNFLKV